MGKRTNQPLPKEVDRLKVQVQDWRKGKSSPGSAMPGEMWATAIRLAKDFGVCRIARATGLDYCLLRKRVEKADALASAVSPVFLELPLGMVVASSQAPRTEPGGDLTPTGAMASGPMIELSTPDGVRMRICLESGRDMDAAGIVAAFLGRRL